MVDLSEGRFRAGFRGERVLESGDKSRFWDWFTLERDRNYWGVDRLNSSVRIDLVHRIELELPGGGQKIISRFDDNLSTNWSRLNGISFGEYYTTDESWKNYSDLRFANKLGLLVMVVVSTIYLYYSTKYLNERKDLYCQLRELMRSAE